MCYIDGQKNKYSHTCLHTLLANTTPPHDNTNYIGRRIDIMIKTPSVAMCYVIGMACECDPVGVHHFSFSADIIIPQVKIWLSGL
jgi:hypothetical protein